MDSVLTGIPGVCVYLDDLLVSGKTKQEHDKNLDLVFTVLCDTCLMLKSAYWLKIGLSTSVLGP